MKDFSLLEKKLKIKFKNKDLLLQAFLHSSFLNEHPEIKLSSNERLEFLGDAVLELVVSEYLYRQYPKNEEGELTSWRASLVNTESLADVASKLGFNDFLLLSKGEAKDTGKARKYILANTFEAFLGSLYLEKGYSFCQKFLEKNLLPKLSFIIKKGLFKDAKSKFQEEAQERLGITPTYKVLKEWGPDHAKNFMVGVFLDEKLIAKGQGTSKQEAEQEAAKKALKIKKW